MFPFYCPVSLSQGCQVWSHYVEESFVVFNDRWSLSPIQPILPKRQSLGLSHTQFTYTIIEYPPHLWHHPQCTLIYTFGWLRNNQRRSFRSGWTMFTVWSRDPGASGQVWTLWQWHYSIFPFLQIFYHCCNVIWQKLRTREWCVGRGLISLVVHKQGLLWLVFKPNQRFNWRLVRAVPICIPQLKSEVFKGEILIDGYDLKKWTWRLGQIDVEASVKHLPQSILN